jgi:hypothetical protein
MLSNDGLTNTIIDLSYKDWSSFGLVVCIFITMKMEVQGSSETLAFIYSSVSQPPGRGPVPGPGINYTGPQEVLLEFVILVF